MVKIKVAKTAGFCFGVDRAVKLVYNEIKKGGKSVTLEIGRASCRERV